MYKPDATRKNILLIDDSTLDLRILIEMMSSRKMSVNVAFNGQDGLHKATMQQPDLILLDVSMPVIDGFTTCRMLKNNPRTRDIPVIFLSSANEVEKRIDGLALGAVDFIVKPFNEQEVIARVEIHLNLSRKQDEIVIINANQDNMLTENYTHPNTAFISAATDYLRQHLSGPPPPSELAKVLGTNEKRLNQAFQAHFSMPVFAWLREERLRQAKELLTSSLTPIAYIAEYLGYSSPANFSKAFHARFDLSPTEIRAQAQESRITQEDDKK